MTILLVGTFINFVMMAGPSTGQFFGSDDAGITNLLNIDNINIKDVELNEWGKLNHLSEIPKPSPSSLNHDEYEEYDTQEEEKLYSDDKDTQRDITEILSINSVVILTNQMNLVQEQKVREIFTNLKITPEVQFVPLNKHPNYTKIMKYLKDYNMRAYQYDNEDHDSQLNFHSDTLDIPRLFIGGLPIANYKDIIQKDRDNVLTNFLRDYGQGLIKLDV